MTTDSYSYVEYRKRLGRFRKDTANTRKLNFVMTKISSVPPRLASGCILSLSVEELCVIEHKGAAELPGPALDQGTRT